MFAPTNAPGASAAASQSAALRVMGSPAGVLTDESVENFKITATMTVGKTKNALVAIVARISKRLTARINGTAITPPPIPSNPESVPITDPIMEAGPHPSRSASTGELEFAGFSRSLRTISEMAT